MFGKQSYCARQHRAFNIAAYINQIINRHIVANIGDALGDNRPLIEVGRYEMNCGAYHFDPAFMGAAVRHRTFETGQEAMVNIDYASGQLRGQFRDKICI